MGSWENDQIVTFTKGQLVESAAGFTVAGNVMPATPQATVTVTEAMLATASRADVGFAQHLFAVFVFDSTAMTGATSGQIAGEATLLGETGSTTATINTTNNGRQTFTFGIREVSVGDVITFKFRLGAATHGGVTNVWWGATCYAQQILSAMPADGGRYLYANLVTTGQLAMPGVTERGYLQTLMSWQFWDSGAVAVNVTSTLPEANRPYWMPTAPKGLYATYNLMSTATRILVVSRTGAAGTTWSIETPRVPQQIQFDRLAVPQLPA